MKISPLISHGTELLAIIDQAYIDAGEDRKKPAADIHTMPFCGHICRRAMEIVRTKLQSRHPLQDMELMSGKIPKGSAQQYHSFLADLGQHDPHFVDPTWQQFRLKPNSGKLPRVLITRESGLAKSPAKFLENSERMYPMWLKAEPLFS